MKQVLTIMLISLIVSTASAQQTNANFLPLSESELLLKKSKSQKTTAWILLGGGVGAFFLGANIMANSFDWWVDTKTDVGGAALFYTGLAMMGGSIPLFVAQKRNKKRAHLIMKSEKVQMAPAIQSSNRLYSAGISITIK